LVRTPGAPDHALTDGDRLIGLLVGGRGGTVPAMVMRTVVMAAMSLARMPGLGSAVPWLAFGQ